MRFPRSSGLVALSLLALLGAGCNPFDTAKQAAQTAAQGAMEEAIKAKTGADLKFSKEGVTYTDKDGRVFAIGEEVKIPDAFPKDIPLYPAAKPTSVSVSDDRLTASILLRSTASVADIIAWYDTEAVKVGWEKKGDTDAAGTKVTSYKRGEGDAMETLVLSVSASTDGTNGSMIVLARQGAKK
jgi:hypothetical protein